MNASILTGIGIALVLIVLTATGLGNLLAMFELGRLRKLAARDYARYLSWLQALLILSAFGWLSLVFALFLRLIGG